MHYVYMDNSGDKVPKIAHTYTKITWEEYLLMHNFLL